MYADEVITILEDGNIDAHIMDDEVIYSLITTDPCTSMLMIKNLNDDHKYYALECYPFSIVFMHEPCDDLQLYALGNNWTETFYEFLMKECERYDEDYFHNRIKRLKLKHGPLVDS
ncbi:hypothetical protein PBI_SCTP2_206 [Salicola phage SCTP-2]|nr:hypothetical protein PBI_SCTP2_206 [Salicola phage SCTP-2]